jgi:hypothetical protein
MFANEQRATRRTARPAPAYPTLWLSSSRRTPRRSCRVGGFVHRVQDSARAIQKGFTRRQEAHATRRAHEQRRADFRFERLDLAAQRGLRDVQPFRGSAHVSFFSDGHEIADLREAHRGTIPKRYWIGEPGLCMVLAWASKS